MVNAWTGDQTLQLYRIISEHGNTPANWLECLEKKKKEATRVEIACSLSRTQSFAGGFKNQWSRVRLCLCEREMVCVGQCRTKKLESRVENRLSSLLQLDWSVSITRPMPSSSSILHRVAHFITRSLFFLVLLSFSYPIDTNQNAMTWINGERL